MDDLKFSGLDEDRIATAAKRIIRQYRLQQQDQGNGGIGASVRRPSAPDDIEGLRLAVDDMGLAIEHMQRLMANREDVFLATLERIERNLAVTAGRIDGLAEELMQVASRPVLELDGISEEQRVTTGAVMREFAGMMDLGRALLDEARQMHALAASTLLASGARNL